MVMKHLEDDGDLSIFAKADEILFACKKGHWWLVKAGQYQTESGGRQTLAPKLSTNFTELRDRFGPEVLTALGMHKV